MTTELKEAVLMQRMEKGPLTAEEIIKYSHQDISEEDTYFLQLPKQVHEVMIENHIISDPVITHSGEESLGISSKDWIYRMDFHIAEGMDQYVLTCRGLDTIADLYLNGQLIGKHRDMFYPFQKLIFPSETEKNSLMIHFHSPVRRLEHLKKIHADTLIDPAHYMRKAPHDFEDFLGIRPYFAGVGIFAPIEINAYSKGVIHDISYSYTLNDDLTEASITLAAEVEVSAECDAVLDYTITDQNEILVLQKTEKIHSKSAIQYRVSSSGIPVQLWWPNGYGEQHLYQLKVSLQIGGCITTKQKRIGFREITYHGPFDITVNHIPVRLWGANLVPITGFTHCYNSERAELLLKKAMDANMNFIRLWGGGEPYPDQLYDLADEYGLLVWGEFFHKWGMYPQDEEFMELYRKEAEYMLKSFRHHPSLLMWCGGNESYMGAEMDHPEAQYIGRRIFEQYGELCKTLDPKRYYQENSPCGGSFINDPRDGDFHGWNHLWYIPYADYPVMFSENSRVSPPILKDLKKYITDPDALWPKDFTSSLTSFEDSLLPPAWMALKTGPEPYWCSPVEEFYDAVSPETLVYRCQAAHAKMMKQIGERLKRGRPPWDPSDHHRCRGQLIWKLNDSWPQIFCGLLDYDLEGGIPYYTIKRTFQQIQVSFSIEDNITIWGVNDSKYPFHGQMEFILFHPGENKILHQTMIKTAIEIGHSAVLYSLDSIPQFKRENILYACLRDSNGHIIARNYDFVEIERNLSFPDAVLSLECQGENLIITTDQFARCIELSGVGTNESSRFFYEDNYFDLMPFETRSIHIECSEEHFEIRAKSFYSTQSASIQFNLIKKVPHFNAEKG